MRADFLVVGSGIAGLRAALDLAAAGDVLVLTKAASTDSNTEYAQGGIAAAVGPRDSPEQHAADTIAAGDGLCEPDAVDVLVRDGVARVEELIAWGARFDREPDGTLSLGREGAHGISRVLHAADATGRELGRCLWEKVAGHPRVRIVHHAPATALLLDAGGCVGVRHRSGGGEQDIRAAATLLATGGAGRVFAETTNPEVATGDGVALAWRAGVQVADLEFVQFHPTVLHVHGVTPTLLSEALRGEGAYLLNANGERFLTATSPMAELAARDVVARAIVAETERSGQPVCLSLAHLDPARVHARFPVASRACRAAGLDLARDRIPVMPAAHYQMGGVATDLDGRTSLPGLFAAGEVACTGVHGANRLASNSLLEGLVFGARAAAAMTELPRAGALRNTRPARGYSLPNGRSVDAAVPTAAAVRGLMSDRVGLTRSAAGLEPAVQQLASWQSAVAARLRDRADEELESRLNLVVVAHLIARAALRREESRGGHCRTDFPRRDDVEWQVHVAEQRRADQEEGRQEDKGTKREGDEETKL